MRQVKINSFEPDKLYKVYFPMFNWLKDPDPDFLILRFVKRSSGVGRPLVFYSDDYHFRIEIKFKYIQAYPAYVYKR